MNKTKQQRKPLLHSSLLFWEIKKLSAMPAFLIFLLLCLLFNVLLIAGNRYNSSYVNYVKTARKTAGSQLGKSFDKQLQKLPSSDYRKILMDETRDRTDIFEQYDTAETAEQFIHTFQITGWAADMLEQKYKKQQSCVSNLARQDASMDVGAAGMTKDLFDTLFHRLCMAVITEGILGAVLLALYLCSSEQLHRTWLTIYSSRRGRHIHREKLTAGAVCACAAYTGIAAFSCSIYAAVWQLGGIWQTNMSTQFNYVSSLSLRLPFIPWKSFTVQTYLAAVLLLGFAAVLLFYGLGYAAGLASKNSYIGFLLLFTVIALNFELIIQTGNYAQWTLYEIALWSPAGLWYLEPLWFTEEERARRHIEKPRKQGYSAVQ